mmetsp:Transcript_105183/g.328953  ORF Transcript_105183/g.328953 Transcript_105183/m.328953 type:complete len:231 (-) Transcript_105183:137-829(-)
MPVEIWLQCTCRTTRPGDVLLAVGDHPALGSWVPEHSCAELVTSPDAWPRWELRAPLALEEGPCVGGDVSYKYVVLGPEGCQWEDLDSAELGCGAAERLWEDIGCLSGSSCPGTISPGWPRNRRLAVVGDSVVFRAEHFGEVQPCAAASWPVCPDWAPAVAGGSAMLGQGKRNSLNPTCELQYRFPRQVFVQPRRARLLASLAQLRHQRSLPPGLWLRVLELVGADLVPA